jgi:hypothetical protein
MNTSDDFSARVNSTVHTEYPDFTELVRIDPLANAKASDTRSLRHNEAGAVDAGHERKARPPGFAPCTVPNRSVPTSDTGRVDRDEHLSRSGLGHRGGRAAKVQTVGRIDRRPPPSSSLGCRATSPPQGSRVANRRACSTKFMRTMQMPHPSPAARAIRDNPATTTTAPMARATRSPAGARRSTVVAAATTAIARRSMIPMVKKIDIRPALQ